MVGRILLVPAQNTLRGASFDVAGRNLPRRIPVNRSSFVEEGENDFSAFSPALLLMNGAETSAFDEATAADALFDCYVVECGHQLALNGLNAFDNLTILIFALYNMDNNRYL
jgi:hypothetical protein